MIVVDTFVGSIVDPALGANAVLNASNPHVALGSGVSGAIEEACGERFQALVRESWGEEFDEPLEMDDCLLTGAGDASAFSWVLHVPAVDYTKRDPQTGGASGPSRVRACTRAALEQAMLLSAEVHPHFVLGLPLLGAGHGGLGSGASANAMLGAIRSFLVEYPNARMVLRFALLESSGARLVRDAAERHRVPCLG